MPTTQPWTPTDFQTLDDPGLEKMSRSASSLVAAMSTAGGTDGPGRWLTFLGRSGVGKTFLATAIYRWWKELGQYRIIDGPGGKVRTVRDGRFRKWSRLLEELRDGAYWQMAELRLCDFLVLDDIGFGSDGTQFSTEKLEELADSRLGRWTVWTSNLDLRGVGERSSRLASRLVRDRNIVVEYRGPDYALRTKTAKDRPNQPMK